MNYIDKDYFLTKIKETELNNLIEDDTGEPDETKLDQAIKEAESTVNSYLKKALKTIPIPEAKVPENIKLYSYYIASYILHENIQYDNIPGRVKDNYDAAMNYLKDVANGRADLDYTEETGEEEVQTNVDYAVDSNWMNRNIF